MFLMFLRGWEFSGKKSDEQACLIHFLRFSFKIRVSRALDLVFTIMPLISFY
jgi:hypothetical protein